MIKAPPLVTTCVGLGVKLTNKFMTYIVALMVTFFFIVKGKNI